MSSTSRGFTLIEVMLAMSVAAFLFAVVSLQFSGSERRASNRAVATVLAENLRTARSQARTLGSPVGVFFKADSTGVSRSIYTVEGKEQPSVTNQWNLSQEYENVGLFTGFWGSGFEVDLSGLQPQDWGPGRLLDPGLIFHPDGSVSSNIPTLNEAFYVVVDSGFQSSASVLNASPTFSLTGVQNPKAIRVGKSGFIGVEDGVPGGDGLARLQLNNVSDRPVTPLPAEARPAPALKDIDVEPLFLDLPPGIDALCHPRGSLTLTTTVEDVKGDSLVCWWESEPQAGQSKLRPTTMTHKSNGTWEAIIEWAPPPDAQPADIFTLTCHVSDSFGNRLEGTLGAAGRVQITPRDKLLIVDYRYGQGDIFTCNLDGSDLRRVTDTPVDESYPRWSRDGSRIYFFRPRPGTSRRDGLGDIFSCEPDGGDLLQITDSLAWGMDGCLFPSPSPDGQRVGFLSKRGDDLRACIITVDGKDPFNPSITGPRELSGSMTTDGLIVGTAWDPSGQYVVVPTLRPSGGYDLVQFKTDGSTSLSLTDGLPNDFYEQPDFSPDGTKIAFNAGIHTMVADWNPTTGLSNVVKTVADIRAPVFSPTGDRLLIERKNAAHAGIYICDLTGNSLVPVEIPGLGVFGQLDWTLR